MTSIALVVGINEYADIAVPNLGQCVADAESVATLLAMPEYGFDVELLLDEQATQRQIKLRSYELRTKAPDTFIVYFAGHGALVGERGYLVSHDGTEGDYGIDVANLAEIAELTGGRSLAILDCCHSGIAIPWRGRVSATSRELFRESKVRTGQALLAACRGDELAAESRSRGHGALTYFLLEALLGGAADQQGEITLPAVYDYVGRAFAENPDQGPVLKAQIEDRFVLGNGFPANPVVVDINVELKQTIRSGQARVEALHSSMGVDAEAWRNGGWIRAASLLEDLINWKGAKTKALPELFRSRDFNDTLASIDGYLARLAAVQPGTLVHDGTIGRVLGYGAFGSVYLVESQNQELAYKIYNSNELNNPMKVERFRRGFRAMQKLTHPNIVSVHSFTEAPLGFLMDFIPGPNLRQAGTVLGGVSERLQYFKTVCQAVGYAHQRGVLHRDIKPENVIVSYDSDGFMSDVHLTDFDLAWFSTATTSIVAEGGIGTIWYAAPEQLHHPDARKARSIAVDIYSLGQLLFFLITDRDPTSMSQDKNAGVLDASLRSQLESPVGVSVIMDLYRSCTHDDQNSRPADTDAVLAAVDRLVLNFLDVYDDSLIGMTGFLREVATRVAGRLGKVEDVSETRAHLISPSHRVTVSLIPETVSLGEVKLVARFAPAGRLLVGGAETFAEARLIVNKRLDRCVQRFEVSSGVTVRRRRGKAPHYESFIDIWPLQRSVRGSRAASEIVSSIAAVLDQYCS